MATPDNRSPTDYQRIDAAIARYRPAEGILDLTTCCIWPDSAASVADRLRSLTGLRTLDLSGNTIGDEGVAVIGRCLPELTCLSVRFASIGPEGAGEIARHLPRLTTLHIGNNQIGEAGATNLAEHLTGLTTLEIKYNGVGEAGAVSIALGLKSLTMLDIRDSGIGDAGVIAIAQHLTALTGLDVGENSISDDGAAAIAERLRRLTALHIGQNAIGTAGAISLARHLPALTHLHLPKNTVGADGALAIAKGLAALRVLDIQSNAIKDVGAVALARQLSALETLNVGGNGLTPAGAIAIAQNLRSLTSLDIGVNQLGVEGATGIAKLRPRLHVLRIGYNAIEDAGAAAIAEHMVALKTLDISSNGITDAGIVATIIERQTHSDGEERLETLDAKFNPLRWSGMEEPLSDAILRIVNPLELLQRLIELREEANRAPIHMGRVVLTGPTGHGKSHLAGWLIAKTEADRSLLRHPQSRGPGGDGTWGADRLQTILTADEHRQPGIPDLHVRILDCGGHPQQLQSHQNLFYSAWSRSVFVLCVRADQNLSESWGDYHLGLLADLKAVAVSRHVGVELTVTDLALDSQLHGLPNSPNREPLRVVVVLTYADKATAREYKARQTECELLTKTHPLLEVAISQPWDAIRGHDLDATKRMIGTQLGRIPQLRAALPKYVMRVRDAIERCFSPDEGASTAPARSSMEFTEFCDLCAELGIADTEGRHLYIVRELDNLGYVVSPQCNDVPSPENPVVLNPLFVQRFLYQRLLNHSPRPADGIIRTAEYRQLTRDLKDTERVNLESLMASCLIAFEVKGRGGHPVGWLVPDLLQSHAKWAAWEDVAWKATLDVPVFLNESVFFEFVRDERDHLERKVEQNCFRLSLHRDGCVLCYPAQTESQARIRFDARRRRIEIEVRGSQDSVAEQWCRQLLSRFERATQSRGTAQRSNPSAAAAPLLEARHWEILKFLYDAEQGGDDAPLQKRIASKVNLGEDTIQLECTKLQKAGLIHRPFGKRKGYRLTEQGVKALASNRRAISRSG